MLIQISAGEEMGQRNDAAGVAKAARGGKRRRNEDLSAEGKEVALVAPAPMVSLPWMSIAKPLE